MGPGPETSIGDRLQSRHTHANIIIYISELCVAIPAPSVCTHMHGQYTAGDEFTVLSDAEVPRLYPHHVIKHELQVQAPFYTHLQQVHKTEVSIQQLNSKIYTDTGTSCTFAHRCYMFKTGVVSRNHIAEERLSNYQVVKKFLFLNNLEVISIISVLYEVVF